MMQTFAPKDIESLSKLSSILIIPFVAAAVYVDFGLWAIERFQDLGSLASSKINFLSNFAKIIAFVTSIVIVTFIVEPIRLLLYKWPIITYFAGFTFLTIGVLGLGHLTQGGERYSFNIFWHLSSLVWGLEIFTDKKP